MAAELAAGIAQWLRRRRERVPDYSDDQIATLEKMGRRGLGILANRVAFQINNVQRTAYLIELIEDGQAMVWVAPRLVLSWDAENKEAQKDQTLITAQIDRLADPSEIAKAIDVAEKKSYVEVKWDTHNSVSNPYHLKLELVSEYLAPDRIIRQE